MNAQTGLFDESRKKRNVVLPRLIPPFLVFTTEYSVL